MTADDRPNQKVLGTMSQDMRTHLLVSEYDEFVRRSDKTVGKTQRERIEIAILGVAAEIGSVVAAVKKRLLASGQPGDWNVANDEIIEELGDVVWYCFALARIANEPKVVNIFLHDITSLKREIGGSDRRAEQIRRVLDPKKRSEFLKAAETFPTRTRTMHFEDYQDLAFLTARTQERTLVEVCLAVLSQLSAELFRKMLPGVELELNRAMPDRAINDILGEIAWHIAALASTFQLTLSEIALENIRKNSSRYDIGEPTPLHDTIYPETEQFPRRFEVAVVAIGKGRARMYFNGKRLGSDLTDNSADDDGYRFHDVMHLANIAKLGWSPVFRGLMRRKRKSDSKVDEIQDGARAQIVEEALIKAVHSEGLRQAKLRAPSYGPHQLRLFLNESEISNQFLGFVRDLVAGLEVDKNQTWEWIQAIVEGYDIFHKLRIEKQGTIVVDLEARSITFRPEVGVTVGQVAGMGFASLLAPLLTDEKASCESNERKSLREAVMKRAIADAAGFQSTPAMFELFTVVDLGDGRVSVKAFGAVQDHLWARKIVAFNARVVCDRNNLYCTAVAMSDD